ncbi:hypothetical protein GCM10023215_33990 [Pseudonocardia yuanmonensis]|uniref:Lipoprotein n=1 Tax=Pseudonocardia yuanmonensis TaxID=1095914 RepID=A0ABP8WT35_9PSEU
MCVPSSPRGRPGPVVLCALALSLVAACTAPAPANAPATAPPEPRPGVAQSTAAAPTTPPDPAGGRADDLAVCGRGPCEVRVDGPASIPLPADAEVTEIRVEGVDADGVALVAVIPGRQVSLSCSGPCAGMRTSTSDGSSSVRLTARSGARITVNQVSVDVRSVGGGSADLELTPR